VVVLVDDGGGLAAPSEEAGAAREWAAVFDEVVAAEEFVEEEQDERAGGGDTEAEGADRRDNVALPEEGNDATADDGAGDAHGERGDGAAGVAAGHDRFGKQADERAETNPDQDEVRDLLELFEEGLVVHGAAPKWADVCFCLVNAQGSAFQVYRQEKKCGWKRFCGCKLLA